MQVNSCCRSAQLFCFDSNAASLRDMSPFCFLDCREIPGSRGNAKGKRKQHQPPLQIECLRPPLLPPPLWILDMYACRAVLRPPAGNLLSTAISFACIVCAIFVSCATKSDGCRQPLTSVYLLVYAECVQYKKQYTMCAFYTAMARTSHTWFS